MFGDVVEEVASDAEDPPGQFHLAFAVGTDGLDPIAEQWERQLMADDLTDVLTGALTEWANRGATGGPGECAHYLTACVTAGYTLDPDTYRQV